MYARAMTGRLGSVIGERDPELLGSVLRTRGTHMFYQVRIGAEHPRRRRARCAVKSVAPARPAWVVRNGPIG